MDSVPKEADSVVSFGLQLCLISLEPDQGLVRFPNIYFGDLTSQGNLTR